MNCTFVRDNLSAYIDGELDDKSIAKVRHHVDECDSCLRELASFEKLSEVARSLVETPSRLPAWEFIASRLDESTPADGVVRIQKKQGPAAVRSLLLKTIAGAVVALAASLLIAASFRIGPFLNRGAATQASVATMNLQPVLELFQRDPSRALRTLTEEFSGEDVSIEQANSSFGHPTYVSTVAFKNALPGGARLASTKLLSFPFCKCPDGNCQCGPGGCNCVACICERPDGSTYIVLEQCKSQGVSFGDLSVKLVSRDGRQLQQVTVDGVETISWEQDTGRLTAIGLRNEAEVATMLASK